MKMNPAVDVREVRRKLGLNQQEFWSRLGVTQSGGSRYESGRSMPRPVQHLFRLVHIEQIDIDKLRREDIEILDYLRSKKPELLKDLRRQARAQKGS